MDELPHNVAPNWSPDGKLVLFLSSRDSDNEHGAWRLWVMDADGSNQRPLSIEIPLDYQYAQDRWRVGGLAPVPFNPLYCPVPVSVAPKPTYRATAGVRPGSENITIAQGYRFRLLRKKLNERITAAGPTPFACFIWLTNAARASVKSASRPDFTWLIATS